MRYPPIAQILERYSIGCVPCNAGPCLLKDIVDIHNLSTDEQVRLFTEISKVIFPNEDVEIPLLPRKAKSTSEKISYSPPLNKLVQEHRLIK